MTIQSVSPHSSHSPVLEEPEIPIIDLELLQRGDAQQEIKLAQALGDLGLVHIKHHGMNPETLNQFYRAFDQFCQRPLAEKESLSKPDIWFQRGWTPPDTERAVISGGQPDFKECYFVAPRPISPVLHEEYPQIFAENIWPSETNGSPSQGDFKETYLELGLALHRVGCELLRGVARAFELDPETFTRYVDGGAHVTRALHYLPLDASQVGRGIRWGEEHTDFNMITLLPGGRSYDHTGARFTTQGLSGLYLRTRSTAAHPEGRRVKGTAPEGCIIAQVGQQLEILTGGQLLATPHEVLPPREPGVRRFSMAHFIHTHPHQILTPLERFKTPKARLAYSPPVLAGNYSLKTLVDIGLAPSSALDKLGYRHYRRLSDQRAHEEMKTETVLKD